LAILQYYHTLRTTQSSRCPGIVATWIPTANLPSPTINGQPELNHDSTSICCEFFGASAFTAHVHQIVKFLQNPSQAEQALLQSRQSSSFLKSPQATCLFSSQFPQAPPKVHQLQCRICFLNARIPSSLSWLSAISHLISTFSRFSPLSRS
jgi:hypothetical protein